VIAELPELLSPFLVWAGGTAAVESGACPSSSAGCARAWRCALAGSAAPLPLVAERSCPLPGAWRFLTAEAYPLDKLVGPAGGRTPVSAKIRAGIPCHPRETYRSGRAE